MIGQLRGKLVWKQPPRLVLDVNGVGYELEAPMSTYCELPAKGGQVELLTHLIVREDAHNLYGFSTEDERRLFRSLIKISGVGARVALAILSGISVRAFVTCVEQEDTASLIRVPGIGKKTAQRLIVEMRDRIRDSGLGAARDRPATAPLGGSRAEREAYEALIALGYKSAEALRMLKVVDTADADAGELVRRALRGPASDKDVA